jgi:site-specific recombinase XerD
VGLSFPWWNLRYSHTSAMRSRLQERVAPATANKALSALRRVLKECWRLGLMSVEDYQRAADLPNVAGAVLPSGRDISHGEISALMADCTAGERNLDYRDGAVLAVMLAGLRRSEVASLALGDVSLDDGRLVVRRAKRNKQRAVYLPMGAVAAVRDWLERRGDMPGPLFLPINKGDRILYQDKFLSAQAIQVILERRRESAGVAPCSPHDFRRTFVGDLLDAGVDLATVQGLVGHASPTTTARYDRRPDAVKAAAVAKLHVPYSRR